MARVISISNHKGGVGKTTIAANLGFALARHFKILLIDFDPQANLSSGLGFENHEENIDLIKIENQLHDTIRGEFILKEMLLPLKGKYDLIIIDCPPSFNILTINALHSSNLILIPAKPEMFSLHGIGHIKKFAKENAIPFKIIFNQVNLQTLLHRKAIQIAKEQFNGNLLSQTIRNTIVLAEAFENAQNIYCYKNKSSGATDFTNLAYELLPFL